MKLGVQSQGFDPDDPANADVLALWQAADWVKTIDCPRLLAHAKPGANLVHRHWWDNSHALFNPEGDADLICDEAEQSGRDGVIVSSLNEVKPRIASGLAEHLDYQERYSAQCHRRGHRVTGIAWATGAYEREDWEYARSRGFGGVDLIEVHCYWADAGLTVFNALRPQGYWQPGDPPIFVGECFRDQVRDGPDGAMIGHGGWLLDRYYAAREGIPPETFTETFVASEIPAYINAIESAECIAGAVGFILGGNQDWMWFELATVAARLLKLHQEGPHVPEFVLGFATFAAALRQRGIDPGTPLIDERPTADGAWVLTRQDTTTGTMLWMKAFNDMAWWGNDKTVVAYNGGNLLVARPN